MAVSIHKPEHRPMLNDISALMLEAADALQRPGSGDVSITDEIMKREERRVVRAAMRWYLWFKSDNSYAKYAAALVKEFDAACAALTRARRKRG